MFLFPAPPIPAALRFPRVRGDVPHVVPLIDKEWGFSPRARGCSPHSILAKIVHPVFPACAGMFLLRGTPSTVTNGFPRVRGDVPLDIVFATRRGGFPRVRGDVPGKSCDTPH